VRRRNDSEADRNEIRNYQTDFDKYYLRWIEPTMW
jgi:hypothetical protein